MKTYYRQDNVGRAKYTVNTSDGIKTNRDGSLFFDINIFKNKKDLDKYIHEITSKGYVER